MLYIGTELPVECFGCSRQVDMVGGGELFHRPLLGHHGAKTLDGATMIGGEQSEHKRVEPGVSSAALCCEIIWRRATHIKISFLGHGWAAMLTRMTLIKLACL